MRKKASNCYARFSRSPHMLAGLTSQFHVFFHTCRILFLCKNMIMNEYTILDKIKIDRPILFLCGPYYESKNKTDRRAILKSKISELYDKKFLPLIIDDFLTKNNIRDESISIQLMEEICAAISLQTYIFLDTLSTSAELGIFANSSFMNELKIFIPKVNDIYNKNNVGFFVKEVALKSQNGKTRVYEYRPRVRRNALATDYIVEFYSFVNDTIPNNIMEMLVEDPLLHERETHVIKIDKKNERPQTPFDVCYSIEDNNITIYTSIKLLFYTTLSIVFCEYNDFFKKKIDDYSKINIDEIKRVVDKSYLNLIKRNTYVNLDRIENIRLCTVLKKEYDEKVINHIIKFLHVFNNYSDYNKEILFKDPRGKIINQITESKYISDIFPLSDKQCELAVSINCNPGEYFERITIKKGKKEREIVKYRDEPKGYEAKEFHKYILQCLEKKYRFSEHSYAYQKGKSIKQCAEKHIKSRGFIKYDIKGFFNSITVDAATDCIIEEFDLESRYKKMLMDILSACFWEGGLPLGFTSSPIISDICLKEFDDDFVSKFCDSQIVYTRYADDILISSERGITEELKRDINDWIVKELKKRGLIVNEKKMQYFNFDEGHTFIRYLGINILYGKNENTLSIGRKYIYDVAKEYIIYDQKLKENVEDDTLFYSRMKIIGKISFIRQIEGEEGICKLKKRLYSYDAELDIDNI